MEKYNAIKVGKLDTHMFKWSGINQTSVANQGLDRNISDYIDEMDV